MRNMTSNPVGVLGIVTVLATQAAQAPSKSPQLIVGVSSDIGLAHIAILRAQTPAVVPIPLDTDGSTTRGVVYDRTHLAELRARASAAGGTPLDPSKPPLELLQNAIVVVAYPLTCDGRRVLPKDIALTFEGKPIRRTALVPSAQAASLLPGVTLVDGSMAGEFQVVPLRKDAGVQVTYGGAVCPGNADHVSFTFERSALKLNQSASLGLPAGSGAGRIRVIATLDPEGRVSSVNPVDGPQAIGQAASAAVAAFQFDVVRVNGVGTAQEMLVAVAATASDAKPVPLPAPLIIETGPPEEPGRELTLGPQSPRYETTLPDVAGLTPATSQCKVATDAAYGTTHSKPIKTGGRIATRHTQYLNALRGPAGQGIRYARVATAIGDDGITRLDVYEVQSAALEKPMRLFLDFYRFEEPQAPLGLACATPIGLAPPK